MNCCEKSLNPLSLMTAFSLPCILFLSFWPFFKKTHWLRTSQGKNLIILCSNEKKQEKGELYKLTGSHLKDAK